MNNLFEVTINFYKKIIPDKVFSKNITRCIEFTIQKAEDAESFWPSLTTDKPKPAWLKVDFNKWKDEDEDDGFGEDYGGGDDFGNMDEMLKNLSNKTRGGGAGMPGLGGDDSKPAFDESDEEDSDDDIPPIE